MIDNVDTTNKVVTNKKLINKIDNQLNCLYINKLETTNKVNTSDSVDVIAKVDRIHKVNTIVK